ncbi:MAG: hypothetical protein HQK56_16690 [Deltaproteobacteria bacterium]|nr:hypothetical protein [Deltaproteobacteria bacterium]
MLLRLIMFVVIGYISYRAVKNVFGTRQVPPPPQYNKGIGHPVEDIMVQDPICQVYVPKGQALVVKTNEQPHYFCSRECRDKYLQNNS